MTIWEAIETRISCRAYQEKPVEQTVCDELRAMLAELNSLSGLRMQLVTPDDGSTLSLAAAMFSGKVTTYIALIGPSTELAAEQLGYYGEKVVLRATQLGLGSCWVAGTYDKASVICPVGENETLYGVIPLGYAAEKQPVKQKMIRAAIRAKDRKLEQFAESSVSWDALPQWFRHAVEAVKLGPSAVNQQPVNFTFEQGAVTAKLWKKASTMALMDMGIAKCHFEEGAADAGVKGSWAFGDQATFMISRD